MKQSNGTETWDLLASGTAVRGGVTQDLGEGPPGREKPGNLGMVTVVAQYGDSETNTK